VPAVPGDLVVVDPVGGHVVHSISFGTTAGFAVVPAS
jgi:hypothetical protein